MATSMESSELASGKMLLWVDSTADFAQKDSSEFQQLSQLTFIPETGNVRPSGVAERRLIRSHASRSASKTTKKKHKDREEDEGIDHLRVAKLRRERRGLKRDEKARGAVTGALVARVDPFETLPVGSTPWRDELIDHWDSVIENTTHLALTSNWLKRATSDSLLMQGTLFMSALHLYALQGTGANPVALLHYKGEAVREVNRRLSTQRDAFDDRTLWAVACLTLGEIETASPENCLAHRKGLESMIAARGGFSNLQGHMRTIAAWVDLSASAFLETKLSFPVTSSHPPDSQLDYDEILPYKANFSFQIMQLLRSPELIARAVQIYAGLWNLTVTLDRLPTKAIRGVHAVFGDKLIQLEVQILELINMAKFNEVDDQDDSDILSIFSTVALIYLYTYLRANPRRSSNIIIAKRLRRILERVDIFRISQVYPDLLLWVLTTAGLETVDPDESFWYIETAKRLCNYHRFNSKAQVNQIVRDFVWRKNARDKPHIVDCTEFWDLVFTGPIYHSVIDETYDRFQIVEERENSFDTDRGILPLAESSQGAKRPLPGYSSTLPTWRGPRSPPSIGSSMSPSLSTATAHQSISTMIKSDSTDSGSEPAAFGSRVATISGGREKIQGPSNVQAPKLTVIPQSQVCQWSLCRANFDSAVELDRHVKVHTKEAQVCEWAECGETFKTPSILSKHVQYHTKPHVCPEPACVFRAATPKDLKRHSATHGLKPGDVVFYCPSEGCKHAREGSDQPFTRRDNARRHIEMKHPKQDFVPIQARL